jgi:hypothetical protein
MCWISPTAVAANATTKIANAMSETICVGVYRRRGVGSGSDKPEVCADAGGVAPATTPPPGSRSGVCTGSGSGGWAVMAFNIPLSLISRGPREAR